MTDSSPSMLKPTLIGGLSCGILGALPIIGVINCACCALIIAGGFLAAFLYSKECQGVGAEFRPGGGAVVGLVAGLFYAIANTLVGLMFKASAEELEEYVDEAIAWMEEAGAPPEIIDMIAPGAELASSFVFTFFSTLLLAAVFSTVGGLIGGAVFKVEAAPPPDSPGRPTPPPASG